MALPSLPNQAALSLETNIEAQLIEKVNVIGFQSVTEGMLSQNPVRLFMLAIRRSQPEQGWHPSVVMVLKLKPWATPGYMLTCGIDGCCVRCHHPL